MKRQKATGQQAECCIQKNTPKHPHYNLQQPDASNYIALFLKAKLNTNLNIFYLTLEELVTEDMPGDWQERIVVDPKVLVGKPLIRGTRLSVEFILDLLANDWTIEQILGEYPQLAREDVMAVLKYAAEMAKEEKVYPLP